MEQHATRNPIGAVPWSYPWYQPWREAGLEVERHLSAGLALWHALNRVGAAPVRFVPHTDLPAGAAYEQFIWETGACPTRASAHDLFNGLGWINFPATKRKLNRLQAAQIALDGVLPTRGVVRDALTLFDENSAFLHAPDALWNALVAKQWRTLFVDLRPLWREARILLFGHALLEKLQAPRKPVTAHVYRVMAATHSLADMDGWVATDLQRDKLATKPFAHLPVLGVPGWWPANEAPVFYDDTTVFRLSRPGADGDALQ